MLDLAGAQKDMGKRVRGVRELHDLDARFRVMDRFGPEYQQILSMPSPPLESMADGGQATELARIGNDGFAELVANHRDRFPGFVASVALNDPEAAFAE